MTDAVKRRSEGNWGRRFALLPSQHVSGICYIMPQRVRHLARYSPRVRSPRGLSQMAKRPDAEVLEYILMNLQILSLKAHEADLVLLESILDAAAKETEVQLSSLQRPDALGEFPDTPASLRRPR
jgi:hypothetical protein